MKPAFYHPVLIDFDGIIKINDSPAHDAFSFLKYLADNKIPAAILSNSTMYTGYSIKKFLSDNGMDFGIPCLTTVDASLIYIRDRNLKVSAYCNERVKSTFSEFLFEENPDAVLIGDLGDAWSYDILNEIFRKAFAGAEIIAMQKNKYWKPQNELCLDAGAFISAIEYAAGKNSVLIGKPSPLYFSSALKLLGYPENSSFIMIGDDLENDIGGAQKIKGKGILVYTGKTKFPLPAGKIQPDLESQDLTGVISYFQENRDFLQLPVHQDQIKHQDN